MYLSVDDPAKTIRQKYVYPLKELMRWGLIEAYDNDGNVHLKRIEHASEEDMRSWRFYLSPLAVEIEQALEVNLGGGPKSIYGAPTKYWGSPDVFVLMPFDPKLQPIFDDHIKPITQELGLICKRADDFFTNGVIMYEIWSAIYFADIVIADCTGRNPNVYYEIGIAHTLGIETILITQAIDDMPFDIRHLRVIVYEYTPPGMKEFEMKLRETIKSIISSKNPGIQAE